MLLIGVYISMQKTEKKKAKIYIKNFMPTIGEKFIMKMNNLIGENKITKKQNEKSRMKKIEVKN